MKHESLPYYPEPASICTKLQWDKDQEIVTSSTGNTLRVRHLKDIGWEITAQPDQADDRACTGAQEAQTESDLSITDQENDLMFNPAGQKETLRLSLETGSLHIGDGTNTYLEASNPFAAHAEPHEIYEGVMSLKVTDFSNRSPFGPIGTLFPTHMVRFQYKKPTGPIIGLPGQTGEMNRDGYRFQLYNTDTFMHTPDRPPMYQSWPILFHKDLQGSGWTCVFHDNPSRTFVDVGDFYPDDITFESQFGGTRVYVLHGDNLVEVSQKLTTLLGGCPMPPEWAFGYQQCRWSYMSTDEVRTVAKRLQEENIPCTALYFDIDHMDEFRVFSNDKEHFGDLRECIDDLHKDGYKAVSIVDPAVKVDENNEVYQAVLNSDQILKNEDGTPFIGKVWPGKSLYPDFREEGMRELWANIQKDWLKQFPFDGVWNDMNEPSNFDGQNATTSKTLHADGTSIQKDWNLYGYDMAHASRLGMEKAGKPHELVITRSGYPGVQQYAVIWHGDNQAWWEHLRLAIDTTIAYSLCGAFYTGPDVPGFTGNPPDDLAIRFFQLGAWLPFFRGHSIYFAKDKEPYAFSAKTREIIYAAIRERAALQDEWIQAYEHACASNSSPILPVHSSEGRIVRDQFLLFNTYLVAPIVERDQEVRSIFLPEGTWTRIHGDPTPLTGNQWITEAVSIEHIPVFKKA